jgi:catabolite regulation protein CreA
MADASEESDQNQSVADNKPNLVRISSPKKEEKEETRLQSKHSSNFKLLRITKSKDEKNQAKKRVVNLLKVS